MTSRRFLFGLMAVGFLAFGSAKEAQSATLQVYPMSHVGFLEAYHDTANFIRMKLDSQPVLLARQGQALFYDELMMPMLKLGSSVYLESHQFHQVFDEDWDGYIDRYEHVWWGKWFEVTSRQRNDNGMVTGGIQQYGPNYGGMEILDTFPSDLYDIAWWGRT